MQLRQKSGHFSAVVQVVLFGSQHDEPFFVPLVQRHAPFTHSCWVVQV